MAYINHYHIVSYFEAKSKPHEIDAHISNPISFEILKDKLSAAQTRRLSNFLKMGLSAFYGLNFKHSIDAITVGTALGCLNDTEKFLNESLQNAQTVMSPTPFIQSTHNALAGNLALLHNSKGYNMTHSHGSSSFIMALEDALMLCKENQTHNVLCLGLDEVSPMALQLFSDWKEKTSTGSIGQGAAAYILRGDKTPESIAELVFLKTVPLNPKIHLDKILFDCFNTAKVHIHSCSISANRLDLKEVVDWGLAKPNINFYYDDFSKVFLSNNAIGMGLGLNNMAHSEKEYTAIAHAFGQQLSVIILKKC